MEKQTAGRNQLGEFAPKFAELNDDVLFGEVWSREDKLSLRDRSMITVAGFIGNSYLKLLTKPGESSIFIANVTNVKHWHGAKKNSWFSHLALEVPGENTNNEWCEPVNDEEEI